MYKRVVRHARKHTQQSFNITKIKKTMYRVDKRQYNLNDYILPNDSSYQDSVSFYQDKQNLEEILSEEMPNEKNADRKTGLFVFADLSDAIRFCCIMTNSRIYEVVPAEDTILFHRGDMNWTEIMNQFINDNNTLKHLAGFYWQGLKTYKPCWEMLFNKVIVSKIIIGDDSTRSNLCREYHEMAGNIERLNFYYKNLTNH
jgi:hypothetical protein